jgi:hypothetical protein
MSAFYVLARGDKRIPRTIRRNRGGDASTTMPPPWRCVHVAANELAAIDAMMAVWDQHAECSIVAAGALTAEQIERYDREASEAVAGKA